MVAVGVKGGVASVVIDVGDCPCAAPISAGVGMSQRCIERGCAAGCHRDAHCVTGDDIVSEGQYSIFAQENALITIAYIIDNRGVAQLADSSIPILDTTNPQSVSLSIGLVGHHHIVSHYNRLADLCVYTAAPSGQIVVKKITAQIGAIVH